MKNPYGIPKPNILVLYFLASFIELQLDLVLALLRENPGVENGIRDKVQVHFPNLQALLEFDIQAPCRVEGYVRVDVLLVIEASLEVEHTRRTGDLGQEQTVLVVVGILGETEII